VSVVSLPAWARCSSAVWPRPEVCPLSLVLAGGFPPCPNAGIVHIPKTNIPENMIAIVKLPKSFMVFLLTTLVHRVSILHGNRLDPY